MIDVILQWLKGTNFASGVEELRELLKSQFNGPIKAQYKAKGSPYHKIKWVFQELLSLCIVIAINVSLGTIYLDFQRMLTVIHDHLCA